MAGFFESIRHLLERLSPHSQRNGLSPSETQANLEEPYQGRTADKVPAPQQENADHSLPSNGSRIGETRSPDLGGLLSAYLNTRAEEMLALMLEGLAGKTAREVNQTIESSQQSISAEIAGVRGDVAASQREFSRIGRELVRSGATLESIQAAVSAVGQSVEQLESSLKAEMVRAREIGEEAGLVGVDEILATLDGLEIGLAEGRELVKAMAVSHRRLKDTTVQRWWRAMGEATGVKRPLPEVPLEDAESLVGGLELTNRRLQDALARRGVKAIEATGVLFDPYVHEAVATEPCPEEQDGMVLREQRRGYRTEDRVIRLSQVVVGRGEPAKTGSKGRHPRPISPPPVNDEQEEDSA